MTVTVTVTKSFEAYAYEVEATKGMNVEDRSKYFIAGIYEDPQGFFDGATWRVRFPRKPEDEK